MTTVIYNFTTFFSVYSVNVYLMFSKCVSYVLCEHVCFVVVVVLQEKPVTRAYNMYCLICLHHHVPCSQKVFF